MGKLYIAYGSSLNLTQMAARCPSASVYAKGVLNNWELVYRGRKANSHATIIRKRGSTVPVLVWEIQPIDEYRLDISKPFFNNMDISILKKSLELNSIECI